MNLKLYMKSSFFLLTILSCEVLENSKGYDKVYQSKSINKSIHNLEVLEKWIDQDYSAGLIPKHVANNYYLVIDNTKKSLFKSEQKLKKYIIKTEF